MKEASYGDLVNLTTSEVSNTVVINLRYVLLIKTGLVAVLVLV